MRVSDAERAEVADRLSKHYGDGRLDQAEFNERLDRAMNAKTQADLNGLTDDLPEVGTRPAADRAAGAAAGRQWPRALPIVLLIVVVAVTWHGLAVLALVVVRLRLRVRSVAVDRPAGVLLAALRPPAPPPVAGPGISAVRCVHGSTHNAPR